jgi:aminomethyltransferase
VCAKAKTASKRSYATSGEPLKKTPLHKLHVELGAKMTGFAGYDMPLQYSDSIKESHLWCRKNASLFDVSHMGQLRVEGKNAKAFLESLVVADLEALPAETATYSYFTNESGGIIDDTIVTNRGDHFYVVVNAGCFEKDMKHLKAQLAKWQDVKLTHLAERALVALQGPQAERALATVSGANLSGVKFMTGTELSILGAKCYAQRSGYTGEDGFEISMPQEKADEICRALLKQETVRACGLGARDSLRLEAGLSLYGNDLDENVTPKQAGLVWAISKRRKTQGGFLGDKIILDQINNVTPTPMRKVGLLVEGSPAREHATIHLPDDAHTQVGVVTSGGFSPSLNRAIAIGFVQEKFMKADTRLQTQVRGKFGDAIVTKMPFVPHTYKRD